MSTRELKFYMERTALHVILPVCSPASDGPTSGVFRKTDLRQNDTFSQISHPPTFGPYHTPITVSVTDTERLSLLYL